METLAERLLKRIATPSSSDCWEWQGATVKGYGVMRWDSKQHYVHRLAYQHWIGFIPEGEYVCHHCDNPPCINPHHLFVGTASDNNYDTAQKGRHVGNRRLARLDITLIRDFYLKGWTQYQLAYAFKTTQGHISRIIGGKRW